MTKQKTTNVKELPRPLILRSNQAVIVLDAKGNLLKCYALRGDKILMLEYRRKKQKVTTLYLEDLQHLG